MSNKKLIVAKAEESNNVLVNWKALIPSLELLHNEQLIVNHRSELIRPLFHIIEKSLNQNEEFEQKTYIQQLCTTALFNVYTKLKSGLIIPENSLNHQQGFLLDECHPEVFNSEIIMECLKRTSDLHTTQQCLMLLSKGAQLFPVRLKMIRWKHGMVFFFFRRN